MVIGGRDFSCGTHVMAIINLTPDSFYPPSRALGDGVLYAVERAVKEGAAVIDIGAQSTRPGYIGISEEEELKRLEEPLYAVRRRFDIPLSVDTYFPSVAERALEIGADMINDVRGLSSPGMAEVIARHNASVCIMHGEDITSSADMWGAINEFLSNRTQKALKAGVLRQKICLDGGIGFGKTKEQNLNLLQGYERLLPLGYALLLGASRKSLFGGTPDERLEVTLAATREAVKKGITFVRVHDVAANVKAILEAGQ